MAHIFRTYRTRIDPETGKRVYVLDSKGRKIPHPKWRFSYIDFMGRRRIGTGTPSRAETEKLALRIELQQKEIREGLRPAPKLADKHASRPIGEVIAEYLAWGASCGGLRGNPWSDQHYEHRKNHLNWWREKLNLTYLKDLGRCASEDRSGLAG